MQNLTRLWREEPSSMESMINAFGPAAATLLSIGLVALNKKLGLDLTDAQVAAIGTSLLGFLGHHHFANRI